MNTKKKLKYKMLPIRLEEETLNQWRRLAHWHEMSMAELIRSLVEDKIRKSKGMAKISNSFSLSKAKINVDV